MSRRLRTFIKKLLPGKVVTLVRQWQHSRKQDRIHALPKLDQSTFLKILVNDLGISRGSTVFVHSSLDALNVGFSPQIIIELLKELVGNDGNLLFPVHIGRRAEEHLKTNPVFDIRRTPSFTGIISELVRRDKAARRSLHPTNSICAIGNNAEELVKSHHESIWPCGEFSPYHRFILENNPIIVGLGVTTGKLSFVHCVEDIMKEAFPVETRKKEIYIGACVDANGQRHDIQTLVAHERIQARDVEKYVANHIPRTICSDFKVMGHAFFRGDPKQLFQHMTVLAQEGITIYPKKIYKNNLLKEN